MLVVQLVVARVVCMCMCEYRIEDRCVNIEDTLMCNEV